MGNENTKFGTREVFDVVLKDTISKKPIFYFESLKMAELGNKTSTVYARGGKGNTKLVGWTGDREIVYKCEDALITPKSLAIYAGTQAKDVMKSLVHKKMAVKVKEIPSEVTAPTGATACIELLKEEVKVTKETPLFVFKTDESGTAINEEFTAVKSDTIGKDEYKLENSKKDEVTRIFFDASVNVGDAILVDFYVARAVTEVKITSEDFPSTFIVEGFTLWRNAETGKDHEAHLTIQKAKMTADFTISAKPDGDPATFSFELEALKPLGSKDMVLFQIENEPILM